jgi:hypothetical protein
MAYMFYEAKDFNQSLSTWKIKKDVRTDKMFEHAVKFNQRRGIWNDLEPSSKRRKRDEQAVRSEIKFYYPAQ